MLIDIHVHTNKHSACGIHSPEEMAHRAIEVGLDGVVITEHDYCWSEEEIKKLRRQFPDLLILRGAEFNVAPDRHHVLVYGITDFQIPPVYPDVVDFVEYVHSHQGAAVWAHPIRYTYDPDPRYFRADFDGIETRAINIDVDDGDAATKIAQRLNKPEVYCSDAHRNVSMGPFACDFKVPIKDEVDLVRAIVNRQFQPVLRLEWLEDALKDKGDLLDQSIKGYQDRGITDHIEIKRRNGASIARIRRVLAGE